jgi:transposase-like protein
MMKLEAANDKKKIFPRVQIGGGTPGKGSKPLHCQTARDLDLHENVLRKWVKNFKDDPAHAFPGHGQQKPEQAEVAALKREIKNSEQSVIY